jgi:hypothetical protein
LKQAAFIVQMQMSTIVDNLYPANGGQALELMKAPQEMRPAVMTLAVQMAGDRKVTAEIIKKAAIYLKVLPGNKIMPNGGDDNVQTPDWLARDLVRHFRPTGRLLDPCRGNGAFCRAMPGCDWFEISEGRDFFTARGHWDWIVANPPYGLFREFQGKAMEVSDNFVFLAMRGAWHMNAREDDMRKAGFALVECLYVPTPKSWQQFGFPVVAAWARRGWLGGITTTRLESPGARIKPWQAL